MPDIEISPSISRRVFEAGEHALESRGYLKNMPGTGDLVNQSLSAVSGMFHRFAQFDTIATGESGLKMGRPMMQDYQRQIDYEKSLIGKKNAAAGIQMPPEKVHNIAMKTARPKVFGNNDANIVTYLKWAKAEHGPQKAARLANSLQIMLQDQPYTPMKFKTMASGKLSATPDLGKKESMMRKNIFRDKALQYMDKEGLLPIPDDKIGGRDLSKLYKASHAVIAPLAALKHTEQFAQQFSNIQSLDHGFQILRASFGQGRKNMEALSLANDAAAEILIDAQADVYRAKNGLLSKIKVLPPEVVQFLSKYGGGAPGMRLVREHLVPMAAAYGHYGASEHIENLIADPKSAPDQEMLAMLGIKDWKNAVARYQANGNVIHPEDSRMAINTAIAQRAFTNNPQFRSRFALGKYGRFMTTYHWIGQNVKMYHQRELVRAFRSRNPISIASYLATVSFLPGVAWGIHKITDIIRGNKDPEDPSPTQRAKLFWQHGRMISDMVGWGVEYSYINAAVNRHLASQILGAQGADTVRLIENFAAGAAGKAFGQKKAMYPFWRELLQDIPYNAGDRLAHSLVPTRAEEQADKPETLRSRSAKRSRERQRLREQEE